MSMWRVKENGNTDRQLALAEAGTVFVWDAADQTLIAANGGQPRASRPGTPAQHSGQ